MVGFALFGSVTYLPLFLQVVGGATPTGSGLQILPLMGGLLITSIGSGQIISRTGKYRPFPIGGTFVMIVGLFLLSKMDASTTRLVSSAYMFVLGLGLGMVMQVLVLAVQNAVEYKDLGVATSGATLFRSVAARLESRSSARSSPAGSSTSCGRAGSHPRGCAPAPQPAGEAGERGWQSGLTEEPPKPIYHVYVASFTNALDRVFVVAAVVAAVAFALSWLLEQRDLRESVSAGAGVGERIGESFAVPKPPDSLAEIARALSVLIGRDGRRHLVEQIAARAGVDLSAAASWLLARTYREPETSVVDLCRQWDVPLDRGHHGLRSWWTVAWS